MIERTIRDAYRRSGSIRAAAQELELSEQAVRRVLLNCGDYTNDRALQIQGLLDAGKTVDEIAEHLHIKRNTVISYLPYIRTPYISPEKTENALRIKKCREQKRERDNRAEMEVDGNGTV